MSPARTFMGLASLILFAGCGLALQQASTPENRCGSDADCPGASCDSDRNFCVGTPASSLLIGFSVLPAEDPLGGAPIQSVFAPGPITTTAARDLTLSPRMTVVGEVRFQGQPVLAEVSFSRPSPIPGASALTVATQTLADPSTAPDGELADYSLRVAGGESYEVVVRPTGQATRALPPMRFTVTTPQADLGRADFVYPDALLEPCGEARFEGCSFTGEVYGLGADAALPEDGLLVRAINPETGEVVSSVASSGADPANPDAPGEPGVFTLRIAPGAGSWVLKITGGEERALFPTVIADPALFFPGTARPRVLVPRLRSVHYVGFIESSAGRRLGNASVTFRAVDVFDSATQLLGSFRTTVSSEMVGPDGDVSRAGRFEVDLLPGTYQVAVTPQGDDRLGVLVRELRIMPRPDGSAIMGQVFNVPDRAQVGGLLLTDTGEPMSGVSLSAVARGRVTADPAAAYNRSNDTLTDGLGQFALSLDVGVYDFVAKPPRETHFPWVFRSSFELRATGEVFSEDLRVSAPVPVVGVVRSADGAAMVDARVTAIAVLPDADGRERTVAVGEATTDADGRYELLLPSSLR
ncbi:MAG: carboxypeptidase regulatory-like domain-containing protein [Deltaproteobacteria bacterium]|nr:carboxypeptidase regulatory-like domain-containing protein [Deltaproteobacteria bacterium]